MTNANDLPTAALHAGRNEVVEILTADIERIYDQLRVAGFRRGNALQLVSHLLAADPRGSDMGVQRFCQVAESLKGAGERAGPGRYDEMAMLALTQASPVLAVDCVLQYRDLLRKAKPRPASDVAFSLAAGIHLAEDSQQAVNSNAGDLAALQSLRAILEAQQAATMAAVSAGASGGS